MPKTYVTTSRFHIEDIATIVAFMEQNKIRTTNRSAPVVKGIEMIANIIRENHPSMTFSLTEAIAMLQGLGIDIMRGNRGARELTKQLQYSELDDYARDMDIEVPNNAQQRDSQECILSVEDKELIEKRRQEELEKHMQNFGNITDLEVSE